MCRRHMTFRDVKAMAQARIYRSGGRPAMHWSSMAVVPVIAFRTRPSLLPGETAIAMVTFLPDVLDIGCAQVTVAYLSPAKPGSRQRSLTFVYYEL